MRLHPRDDGYPQALFELDTPPVLTVSGALLPNRVVAIVGSRRADYGAQSFAHQMAYHLAKAGIVVASGGAEGIDEAAHRGALKAPGGATWSVTCTGVAARPFPLKHKRLFDEIAAAPGSCVIWPFADAQPKTIATPRYRNGILCALAHVVVVIQARVASGSLNAATWARQLARPLYVVPGAPWDARFHGSAGLILGGATPLWTIEQLFDELDLPAADLQDPASVIRGRPPQPVPIRRIKRRTRSLVDPPRLPIDWDDFTDEENQVFSSLSQVPTQQDKIIANTGLGASSTLTALLTLSLRDVVVEGPDGFFRRRSA